MKDVYILGIESSCDEMSASIVKNSELFYLLNIIKHKQND